jgi:hypothetical protein
VRDANSEERYPDGFRLDGSFGVQPQDELPRPLLRARQTQTQWGVFVNLSFGAHGLRKPKD